jgi:hypothetical protein
VSARSRALAATVALSLGSLVTVAVDAHVPVLRPLLGLLAVLVLPGYAWSHWLPSGPETTPAETGLRVVGLSLVTAVLAGALLALTPIGLDATSAATALAIVTIVVSGAALLRGREPVRLGLRPTLGGAIATAVVLASGATALAISGEDPPALTTFTELSLSPAGGGARLTVTSHDRAPARYSVRVTAGGTPIASFPVTLAAGGRWSRSLPAGELRGRVVAELVTSDRRVVRRAAWEPAR